MLVSVIIPTYNGRSRIQNTLDALSAQDYAADFEIIVVDDGSTDGTADFVRSLGDGLRVLTQENQGPAAARNHGAREAKGEIIIFTDDDCVPEPNWLSEMIRPFREDSEIVGLKGIYKTVQRSLVARFVQAEYEDKYKYMSKERFIDFVDSYSAAFKRDVFMELNGYDTEFPVACAEDVELSYRMFSRGYKMVCNPKAVVAHTHPDRLMWYLQKKFKFAYWRMIAVRKNPAKLVKDSHTPQLMKLQLLFPPLLYLLLLLTFFAPDISVAAAIAAALFIISTVPFLLQTIKKDVAVGILTPFFLFLRANAQFLGVSGGVLYLMRGRK